MTTQTGDKRTNRTNRRQRHEFSHLHLALNVHPATTVQDSRSKLQGWRAKTTSGVTLLPCACDHVPLFQKKLFWIAYWFFDKWAILHWGKELWCSTVYSPLMARPGPNTCRLTSGCKMVRVNQPLPPKTSSEVCTALQTMASLRDACVAAVNITILLLAFWFSHIMCHFWVIFLLIVTSFRLVSSSLKAI